MKYLAIFTMLSAVAGDLDPRLPVSTLVREDIFAGLMAGDMVRFERGAANVDRILNERPDQRGSALVWKAGATLFRSILARERGDHTAYKQFFRAANEYYAEGERTNPKDISVVAGTAGSLVILTDRLAPEDQPELWEKCYVNFRKIADLQKPMMDKLPLHLKGELLSGLAQSAQRTGRLEEATRYLEQLSVQLPGSPYEAVANKWRSDPAFADRSSLACKTCHDPGRLENRLKALEMGTPYAPR